MTDYVEMAKKVAAEKRAAEAAKRKKEQEERDKRVETIDEMKSLIKESLKQWDGVAGLSCNVYKDATFWRDDFVEISRGKEPLLKFACHWDHWTEEWSDDCKSDAEGPMITVTYCNETMETWTGLTYACSQRVTKKTEHRAHWANPEVADRCLKEVAGYLAKFF